MGTQNLGIKKVNKIARLTNFNIVRAWTTGDHNTRYVVTDLHVHGLYHIDTNIITWFIEPFHFTSCYDNMILKNRISKLE